MFTALFVVISLLGSIAPGIATAQDAGTPAPEVAEEPAAQTTEQPAAEQPADAAPVEQPAQEAAPSVEQPAEEPAAEQPAADLPAEEAAPVEQPADETSTVMTDVAPDPVEVPAAPVSCQVAEGVSPWIASDLADYPPGAWVTLSGGDWAPGQTVEIFVDDDGVADAEMGEWSHFATVTADSSGAFTYGFNLPEWFVADYFVTATGECSQATTAFTDGNLRVMVSGITPAPTTTNSPITYILFSGPNCTGNAASSVTFPISDQVGVDNGKSAQLIAGSVSGYSFAGWTDYTGVSQGAGPVCANGWQTGGPRTWTAGYAPMTKQDQAITFTSNAPNAAKYGDTYAPTATGGGSVNAIVFGASGACSFADGTVAMTGIGDCTVTANQAGNDSYNAAPQVSQTFSVGKRLASVTPAAAGKTFGEDDPELTGTLSGFLPGDNVTASYSRTSGEGAGTYIISATLSPQGALGNYQITNNTAQFTIARADQTITITSTVPNQPKVGGTYSPEATGGGSGEDVVFGASGSCSVTGGTVTFNSAGECTVTADQAGNSNYDPAPQVEQSFTVGKGAATVMLGSLAHTYDGAPKEPTVTTFPEGLAVTFTYSRDGEEVTAPTDAGDYEVTATVEDDNYEGSTTATLTIEKAGVTVTIADKSKTYGEDDPELTYEVTGAPFGSDAIQGSLTRAPGEDVTEGGYAITGENLSLSGNYDLNVVPGTLTIEPRAISVAADPDQTKTYGDVDPELTHAITDGSLVDEDAFIGSLDRAAGENVGTYSISQGTLTLGANYHITFEGADFTITAREITITADTLSKVYGDDDPALTYQVSGGSLVTGDDADPTGALTREPGEDVDSYAIQLGDLNLGTNYQVTFEEGTLTITARPVTVTANDQSKVYGEADPTLTYSADAELVGIDAFTGDIEREAGNDAGNYSITRGTLELSANYLLTFVPGTLTIEKKPASVAPSAASKSFGQADPTLTGTLSGFLESDGVTATYSRTSGEGVATYTISATLSPTGLLGNYDIDYKTATFTIAKATWTVKGFYQPLDGNGVVNTAKGGSTIPVKFEVFQGDTEITDPSKVKIVVQTASCSSGAAIDEIEETSAGSTSLRFDTTSGQFIYNWKTPKSVGTCYKLSVAAAGTNEEIPSTPSALVKLK